MSIEATVPILESSTAGMIAKGVVDVSETSFNQGTLAVIGAFANNHLSELNEMYGERIPVPPGPWRRIGFGASKGVYTHPELPGMVVKIPAFSEQRYEVRNGVEKDYLNLQQVMGVASAYPRIHVPKISLVETPKGPIAIQEKFEFEQGDKDLNKPEFIEAVNQLDAFVKTTGLCDVIIGGNARFLQGTDAEPRIGVFDFDCRNPPTND